VRREQVRDEHRHARRDQGVRPQPRRRALGLEH
jgi:hypothetical protein